MNKIALMITLLIIPAIIATPTQAAQLPVSCLNPNIECISNGRLTVAVDTDQGGAIVGLFDTEYNSGKTNLINHHDVGRGIQLVQRGLGVSHNSILKDDFSDIQQLNNWSYHWGSGPNVQGDLIWNADHDRWERRGGRMPWIYATWIHPDYHYDAILNYRAPSDGVVSFRGLFENTDCGGGDGFILQIFRNNTLIHKEAAGNCGKVQMDFGDIEFLVRRGDDIKLSFDANSDNGWDSIEFMNWGRFADDRFVFSFYDLSHAWRSFGAGDLWNPTQAGGCNAPSYLESFSNNGAVIYTRTKPRPFGCSIASGQPLYFQPLTIESWISFYDQNTIQLDYRVSVKRNVLGWTGELRALETPSEVPVVSLIGPFYHFWAYEGSDPWTRAPLTQKVDNPCFEADQNFDFGIARFYPTENWLAAVDDSNWGIGLIHIPNPNANLRIDFFDARDDTDMDCSGDPNHNAGEVDDEFVAINAVGSWGSAAFSLDETSDVLHADFFESVYLTTGTLTEIRDKAYLVQGH